MSLGRTPPHTAPGRTKSVSDKGSRGGRAVSAIAAFAYKRAAGPSTNFTGTSLAMPTAIDDPSKSACPLRGCRWNPTHTGKTTRFGWDPNIPPHATTSRASLAGRRRRRDRTTRFDAARTTPTSDSRRWAGTNRAGRPARAGTRESARGRRASVARRVDSRESDRETVISPPDLRVGRARDPRTDAGPTRTRDDG